MTIQKIGTVFILTLVAAFLATSSFAGLIDYSKRTAKTATKKGEVSKAEVSEASKPNALRVVSRSEGIYDTDRDGWLQSNELIEYYTDVINTVQRKGSFKITDGLESSLKQFDANDDGRIGRYETNAIRKLLLK